MIHSRLQNGFLIVGYLVYLLLGALVFQVLEKDAEQTHRGAIFRMKEDFLKNFTSLSPAEVKVILENLMEAVRTGIYSKGNESPDGHSNWGFSNSFFFAGSMLATIGYGNVSPKTAAGQIFCVFFALFGIPLNIVFLHRIGKILSTLCERFAKWLYQKGMKKKTTRCLTLLFFLLMGILVFLCVPSFIFQEIEGWTYSEAIYFAFITLSTIGFGDYVTGRQHDKNYFPGYRILVAIWIIFGLAWIALLFNLLTALLEEPEEKPIEEYLQVKRVTRKKKKQNPEGDPPSTFPLENDLSLHPKEDEQKNQL
ncbi:potassium channel subfamily K member 16-like [Varanus komodoensis]|uniref:potassium channel subfamily K member 16-like n=1 Tax=Varanus komodoensis TaxID=61221 RepID=UPI001CF7AFF9|nr:potassium channel subfamily K member 16-like [Varanus komodoensis]